MGAQEEIQLSGLDSYIVEQRTGYVEYPLWMVRYSF